MRRALRISAVSGVILAAAVGSAFLGRGNAEPDQPTRSEAAGGAKPAEKAVEPERAAEAPKAADTAKPAATVVKAVDERAVLLEAVGGLAAAHYFQTYLNLGFIADGKTAGTYSEKDARRVLDSVLSILNSLDGKLEALAKIELDKDDRGRVEQLQAASALLRQQGKELRSFWDTGKADDAARYESLRKNAWATISKLMGIAQ